MIGNLKNIYRKLFGSPKKIGPLIPETRIKGFIREISPNDSMYIADDSQYYYWGQWSLDSINEVLDKLGKQDIQKILDLPCGHGRAIRFLKSA
ncbi:MAG: hypothetical protein KDB79_15765, partial [Acidobacteria bacterium]|nr:hypothetical protein [Acidobacteriota bacterium]